MKNKTNRRTYLEKCIAKAVLWAWKEKARLEKKGWKAQDIADHILCEVGRMPCGIGCTHAVSQELKIQFTQVEEPEVEEEEEL